MAVALRGGNNWQQVHSGRETLPGYAVINLAGSYQVNQYLNLFARVDNLFDKHYQEILGFGTSGVAGYGGVKVTY